MYPLSRSKWSRPHLSRHRYSMIASLFKSGLLTWNAPAANDRGLVLTVYISLREYVAVEGSPVFLTSEMMYHGLEKGSWVQKTWMTEIFANLATKKPTWYCQMSRSLKLFDPHQEAASVIQSVLSELPFSPSNALLAPSKYTSATW